MNKIELKYFMMVFFFTSKRILDVELSKQLFSDGFCLTKVFMLFTEFIKKLCISAALKLTKIYTRDYNGSNKRFIHFLFERK